MDEDERQLAHLGYKQELTRAWSSFTNFAISFTIISVLAGCFTNFFAAWNAGGPVGISIGWPGVRVAGGVLDGRADLGLPHRGRSLLVGGKARWQGVELVHRLVQHHRPDRH